RNSKCGALIARPFWICRCSAHSTPRRRRIESDQAKFCQLVDQLAGHGVAGKLARGEIRRRILLFEIAPALMRAFGARFDRNEPGFELDPPAPVFTLLERPDGRAGDDGVLMDPVERSA